ncbi:Pectinesterase [Handroanthus impetiginosus]|uniref:Pectinesterase n=1 Tax=Handroanthus impetiginosus TaxID=429701 RepID=A0A2G9H3V0_9LAMI|nr:Pectinesterase [Handroanthus impetiginosus]
MATSSIITSPKNMSTAILIRVDQSGQGDYTKIQDAINSVPSNNSELVFIWVKPGTYREKLVVPADKPFITLSGTEASDTIITWNDGGEEGSESPTVNILASDFVGRYLTIQNKYGKSGKGVALRVSGDKAAFYGCRILSYQDTLLDDSGRHYYKNCYIEGATDFVFGNGASLFERCHLHSISEGNGAITAQKRESPLKNTGYVFLGCKITGIGGAILGRPWGSYSRVIYALTYMSGVVQPEGWNDWGDETKQKTVYYGEYKCYGPGAKRDKRAKWSHNLTNEEAAPFLNKTMIGGRSWLRAAPTQFNKTSN